MTSEHVAEVPANDAARATGPTTITVTWDAPWYTPWYAGSTPLNGYDIVVTDSSGVTARHQVQGDHPSVQVTHPVGGETNEFMVAGRNDTGTSAFSIPCGPVAMTFSLCESARHEAHQMRARLADFRRGSLTKQVPTGAATRSVRDE